MHAMLRGLQDKTNNGQLVSAHHQQQQKLVTRREHSLQTAKVKLSTARSQNMTLKLKVDDLRREKMLQLQILNDLVSRVSCEEAEDDKTGPVRSNCLTTVV